MRSLNAVRSGVTACARGRTGVVQVRVTATSTGRVESANVVGALAGTPEGSCMERAVRYARFPHFTRPSFTVVYPFRL